jgi:FkbM family methyltransferase
MSRLRLPPGSARAISRSLRVYHGDKSRHPAMDALHGRFIRPGNLAFDIGSHVGDRVSSFRRLGARVVALEPQPACMRVLRLIHGRDPAVTLVNAAGGDKPGEVTFRINSANPTVSTVSEDFVRAAEGAGGWEGQVWDTTITVPSTTLDELIARHGKPAFIKIDVEGFEDHVLSGLSQPVPALSFEFTTIGREVAFKCLDRLARLGPYRFDIALGETQVLTFGEPVSAEVMARHIADLPHEANSGDVYAIFEP